MNASDARSYLLQGLSASVSIEDAGSCYCLNNSPGEQLLVSVDTLVSGVHFPQATSPEQIAHKALAVNLSDIASMGGRPEAYTLSLVCPDTIPTEWLLAFRQGLQSLTKEYELRMLDCVVEQGPLSITVQIYGYARPENVLLRSAAQVADLVYVSGCPGEAAGALKLLLQQHLQQEELPRVLLDRLNMPQPRLQLGEALGGIAHACIDVSDGLLADLGHILEQSGVGADIYYSQLPVSPALLEYFSSSEASDLLLSGGDDYELCFTIPQSRRESLEAISHQLGLPCTCIGNITTGTELRILDAQGKQLQAKKTGYQHFLE